MFIKWIILIITFFNVNCATEIDSDQNSKIDDRCPCVSKDICPRIFGTSLVDKIYIGKIDECMEMEHIRCCGVSTSIHRELSINPNIQSSSLSNGMNYERYSIDTNDEDNSTTNNPNYTEFPTTATTINPNDAELSATITNQMFIIYPMLPTIQTDVHVVNKDLYIVHPQMEFSAISSINDNSSLNVTLNSTNLDDDSNDINNTNGIENINSKEILNATIDNFTTDIQTQIPITTSFTQNSETETFEMNVEANNIENDAVGIPTIEQLEITEHTLVTDGSINDIHKSTQTSTDHPDETATNENDTISTIGETHIDDKLNIQTTEDIQSLKNEINSIDDSQTTVATIISTVLESPTKIYFPSTQISQGSTTKLNPYQQYIRNRLNISAVTMSPETRKALYNPTYRLKLLRNRFTIQSTSSSSEMPTSSPPSPTSTIPTKRINYTRTSTTTTSTTATSNSNLFISASTASPSFTTKFSTYQKPNYTLWNNIDNRHQVMVKQLRMYLRKYTKTQNEIIDKINNNNINNININNNNNDIANMYKSTENPFRGKTRFMTSNLTNPKIYFETVKTKQRKRLLKTTTMAPTIITRGNRLQLQRKRNSFL